MTQLRAPFSPYEQRAHFLDHLTRSNKGDNSLFKQYKKAVQNY